MRQIIEEFGSGLRSLSRSPAFAITASAVLALGIGANTAVFSVVSSVLFSQPPFEDPDALVVITARSDDASVFPGMSVADFEDIGSSARELDDVSFLSWTVGYDLTGGDRPERVSAAWVGHRLFGLLAAAPVVGRGFRPEDDRPGAAPTAVLSRDLWERRFGGDRSVIGRSVTLDGRAFEIIGVMPASFRIGPAAGLWLPVNAVMPADRRLDRAARARTLAIARLRPGSTVETARRELEDIAGRLAADHPATNAGVSLRAVSYDRWSTGEIAGPARILTGVVAFVLLIACANIANLLLARMPARRHEMAVRASMGAARTRLIRMLLVENLALAAVAGTAGLALAWWGVGFISAVMPSNWTGGRPDAFAIDARVLGFTALLSVVTALAFGIVPALRLSRVSLQDVMKSGSTRTGGTGGKLRGALVAAEIALALVLLVAAGTLLRALTSFRSLDLGFDASSTLTFRTELPAYRYADPAAGLDFMSRVLDELRRDPRVLGAAAETRLGDFGTTLVVRDGAVAEASDTGTVAAFAVSDDYFATRRIAVVRGRDFSAADRTGSPHVAIVNESMAAQFWPGGDPLGRQIRAGDDAASPWYTIVGVIADVRQPAHTELTIVPHSVYVPIGQQPGRSLMFYAWTRNEPGTLAPALADMVAAVDPAQPVVAVRTLDGIVATEAADRTMMAALLGSFGAIGLLLAVIGIYGVMSYAVAARKREIAIRMGLGARAADMRRLIVGDGARLTAIGVVLGLAGSWAAMRALVASVEFVEGIDATVVAGVAAVLAVVASIACWVPARRAMRVQPMDVLRYD